MKKILSERNLVVILFIAAFVVFSFAQEDAKKIEKMQQGSVVSGSELILTPKQTAGNLVSDDKNFNTATVK